MTSKSETTSQRALALLRFTLGLILLATWYENLSKGLYTASGIEGLFDWIFNEVGGGPGWYRAFVENTVLAAPGAYALFQLVAELMMALGLLLGGLTRLAGGGATFFFVNLFLAYFGGNEWIWTYVLLTASAFAVTWSQAGRTWGLDGYLHAKFGEAPYPFLW